MTLVLSWIRKVGGVEELCIASDSRVTSGQAWDCCPKIKMLNRGDCALAFAGDTAYAYPMMEQSSNAVNIHPKSSSRATDITDLSGHLVRVISNMREYLHDSIQPGKKFAPESPKTQYIFAGFSWKLNEFKIWQMEYNEKKNVFIRHEPKTLMLNVLGVLADVSNNKSFPEGPLTENKIRRRIFLLMEKKGKKAGDFFDMEPFEVLTDMIRNDDDWAIGGTPQLVKVYKHMNSMPYGIYWPNKLSNQITLLGRPLMDYEQMRYPILDPDTLLKSYMKVNNEEDFTFVHDDGTFDKYREIKDIGATENSSNPSPKS